jgi:hypothetical protein
MQRGQGSIEYLLLLAAAVVVVGIVISFMITTVGPVQSVGNQQTYDFTCKTLNTNSFVCGCYECNNKKGGLNEVTGTIKMANQRDCNTLAVAKSEPLLSGTKCIGTLPAN